MDICKKCMKFHKKYEYNLLFDVDDLAEFCMDWRKLFIRICQNEFGFSKKNAQYMFDEFGYGNWVHLNMTDEEKAMTADDWLEKFLADVFYCSDRWSLDRLLRCHWQYRKTSNAFVKHVVKMEN